MRMFILLLGVLLPAAGVAQQYAIDWHGVAAGGGTSTDEVYSVSGTIGQPDAGQMSGGNYFLTDGYWAFIGVVQTAGLPVLSIARSGNSVIVSWPATGSYTLQQTGDLKSGNWVPITYPITTNNGTISVTILSPAGIQFFRLQ